MRTLHKNLYYPSRSDQIRLYHLTDLHVGAAACDEALLRRYVQAIQDDPYAYWLGGGDYIDAIARKGDKRYQESTMARWLQGQDDVLGQQRDYVIELLRPIAGKCLGLVNGNHEHAALRFYDRDIYWELVSGIAGAGGQKPEDLALGIHGFIVLKFRRTYGELNSNGKPRYGGSKSLSIYAHHGYGGGRLPGGHALALGRVLGDYECDLALLGHRHVTMAVHKTVVRAGGKTAKTIQRWAMFCGTFLGAYIEPSTDGRPVDTYPEHAGLPPSLLGTPLITITPDRAEFAVTLNHNVSGGITERGDVETMTVLEAA